MRTILWDDEITSRYSSTVAGRGSSNMKKQNVHLHELAFSFKNLFMKTERSGRHDFLSYQSFCYYSLSPKILFPFDSWHNF